jgi:exosome complex component CSL4
LVKSKLVVPGQQIAVSEEGEAASGAMESEGAVYATVAGNVFVDPQTYAISVKSKRSLVRLREGDIVNGLVHDIYDTVALIEFEPVAINGERKAYTNRFAYLRISEVSKGYVENFRDVLRIGDVIIAKVREIKPLGIYLSIMDPALGVVKAKCSNCRRELRSAGRVMECPNCKNRETRKMAAAASRM